MHTLRLRAYLVSPPALREAGVSMPASDCIEYSCVTLDRCESNLSVRRDLDSARGPRCGIDKNIRKQFRACGVAVRLEIRYARRRQHFVIDQELPVVLSCRLIQYGVSGVPHDARQPHLL